MSEGREFPFSEPRIAALPDSVGRQVYHKDAKFAGLQVCVGRSGSKVYYFVRRIGGRPTRVRLGSAEQLSVEAARKAAAKLAGELADGKDPQAERLKARKQPTVAELWEAYLELHAKPRKRTWRDDERQYRKYLAPFHSRRLASITASAVARWHVGISTDHGPVQANRAKALLATMFSKACKAVDYEGPNPCKDVPNFPERSRERFLLPSEMKAFFDALGAVGQPWHDLFQLALFTGGRRGNVASMRWDELDLNRMVWLLPADKTKNKRPAVVVLPPPAIAILAIRLADRNGSPWVFPAPSASGHATDPRKAWARLLAASGLENLHLHDLRRSLGSWQAQAGASLAIIGKSLGHVDLKSTQVYARLQTGDVMRSVTEATAKMLEAAGPQNGKDVAHASQESPE